MAVTSASADVCLSHTLGWNNANFTTFVTAVNVNTLLKLQQKASWQPLPHQNAGSIGAAVAVSESSDSDVSPDWKGVHLSRTHAFLMHVCIHKTFHLEQLWRKNRRRCAPGISSLTAPLLIWQLIHSFKSRVCPPPPFIWILGGRRIPKEEGY